MKKSTLILTLFLIGFMFSSCSEKSVTHSEQKEKSIEESPAEYSFAEFQDDLSSLNACTYVYCLQRKRIYKL